MIIWLNKTIVSLCWQCYSSVIKILLFFLLFLISTSIREHVRNDTETVFHKMLFFLLLFSSLPLAASVKLREVYFFFSSLRRTRENRNKYSGEFLGWENLAHFIYSFQQYYILNVLKRKELLCLRKYSLNFNLEFLLQKHMKVPSRLWLVYVLEFFDFVSKFLSIFVTITIFCIVPIKLCICLCLGTFCKFLDFSQIISHESLWPLNFRNSD